MLYVKGRMPHSFIPTLATLNAASGLALLLSDGAPTPGMPGIVTTIGGGDVARPIPVRDHHRRGARRLLAGMLARKLRWGRWIYLVGGDREAARRLGIPVDRVIMSVFVFCGFCRRRRGRHHGRAHERRAPDGRPASTSSPRSRP